MRHMPSNTSIFREVNGQVDSSGCKTSLDRFCHSAPFLASGYVARRLTVLIRIVASFSETNKNLTRVADTAVMRDKCQEQKKRLQSSTGSCKTEIETISYAFPLFIYLSNRCLLAKTAYYSCFS